MVLINYAGREINAKIVYYGPGLSGKTTNLECIYASVPSNSRGKMVSMKTRQDRTLFFDFLPLELGEVHGFRTRFLLYTVPGQVFYNATRKLVLKGADAVVFVADSGLGKLEENQESLRNLDENLREQGLSLDSVPFVIQYNKRDLPQVYAVPELEAALNPRGAPSFEAAAASGQGVYETLHAVSRLLFQRLMSDLRPQPGRPAANAAAAPPPQRAAVAPRTAPPATLAAATPARPASQPALAPVGVGSAAAAGAASPPVASAPPVAAPARPAVARAPIPEPTEPTRWRGPLDPSVLTVAPAQELGAVPGGVLPDLDAEPQPSQLFGTPASGHVPGSTTPSQILDSVQASTDAMEAAPADAEETPHGEYSSYGHIVDLSAEQAAAAPAPAPSGGFIKDPMRRVEAAKPGPGRSPVAAGSAVRTQHVSVVVSKADLKPGGTLRIVLDLKFEP